MNLIVGITGASGTIYGRKLLEFCNGRDIETTLILSSTAKKIIGHELNIEPEELKDLSDENYENDELEAPISSGSVETDGMVVLPCSMKTLGAIANGISDNLISRSADVTLKEDRKLVLVPRESPLRPVHLENMRTLSQEGAVIMPATPGFYHHPQTISDLTDFMIGKVLDQFEIEHELYESWKGGKDNEL